MFHVHDSTWNVHVDSNPNNGEEDNKAKSGDTWFSHGLLSPQTWLNKVVIEQNTLVRTED